MTGIDWILVCLVMIGFLPLAIIVYKKRLVARILREGICTQAHVYSVRTAHKSSTDIVYYAYQDQTGRQYSGILTTKIGAHKTGEKIDIYYLPEKPNRSTIQGAWKSPAFLIFGIVIALFVIFAAWKIHVAIQDGSM
jgi:Protein of unknown function (DUF3592)